MAVQRAMENVASGWLMAQGDNLLLAVFAKGTRTSLRCTRGAHAWPSSQFPDLPCGRRTEA